jgi:hypothetical protein
VVKGERQTQGEAYCRPTWLVIVPHGGDMKRRDKTGTPPPVSKYAAKRYGLRETRPEPGAARAALENRQIAAQVLQDVMSVPKFSL